MILEDFKGITRGDEDVESYIEFQVIDKVWILEVLLHNNSFISRIIINLHYDFIYIIC